MYSKQFNQHSVISDNSKTNQLSNGSGTMCKIEALNDSAISNSKNVNTSSCIENTSDGTNTSSVNNSSDISYFDKNIPKHEKERMPIVQSSEEEKDENLLSGDNNLKIVEKSIRITTPESGESSDMTTSHESGCSSASSIQEIVEDTSTITNDFDLTFHVGGNDATPGIQLHMENCHLEVPTHGIEDIISMETNFHALPSNIESADELTIKYKGA